MKVCQTPTNSAIQKLYQQRTRHKQLTSTKYFHVRLYYVWMHLIYVHFNYLDMWFSTGVKQLKYSMYIIVLDNHAAYRGVLWFLLCNAYFVLNALKLSGMRSSEINYKNNTQYIIWLGLSNKLMNYIITVWFLANISCLDVSCVLFYNPHLINLKISPKNKLLTDISEYDDGDDQNNEIIVRGGGPGENLFIMDHLEIPNPNRCHRID